MRKLVAGAVMALILPLAVGQVAAQTAVWPSVKQQLNKDRIRPGTALERLILANQDFSLLRPEESRDPMPVPPWLRVLWRKNNPKQDVNPLDPTHGYPLVLKEVYQWMLTHQDLKPGMGEPDSPPVKVISKSGEQRISGSSTVSRSESDIRVNYNNPSLIIGASNNIGGSGQQAMFFSSNGGVSWGQTSLPLASGDSFQSDPTVDWLSTGTAVSTTLGINSTGSVLKLRAYVSTNNGATWTLEATPSGTQTNVDKQMIWTDHSATSSFKDTTYAIYHNGNPAFVTKRSPTGTWSSPLQVSGTETTGTGIGADIKSNSAGDVFGAWPDTGSRGIYIVKSTNGGVSFGARTRLATTFGSFDVGVPAFNSRRMLIYVSIGAYKNGSTDNVYALWNDLSGASGCTAAGNEPGASTTSTCKSRIWFNRSTNGGTTWESPRKVNDQSSLNDQFNPWLVVDETSGKIGIMYYDTVADSGRKKVHVYYQSSADNGSTWTTPFQVTTSQTDETISGADSGNQFGDYNALSGINGLFFPSWTDRRSGSREEIWTTAIADSGVACTPPVAPTGLVATAAGTTAVNLVWSAVSGATSYNILRSTTSGGPYTQVGTSATTSFADSGLTCNTPYFYVVQAVASCASGNSTQASATTSTCVGTCTTTTRYTNGFETGTGVADWTRGTFLSGGTVTDWRGIQTCSPAHGGTKIFRFGATSCTGSYAVSQFNFGQPNGTAGIAIPAGATTTRLSFWHRRGFESNFDGGTLFISTDGANYTQVPATAILSGSYTGTTSTSGSTCTPSGAGSRPVWTGSSSSFTNTVVDLDAACNAIAGNVGGCAGKSVRIAFTTITDCTIVSTGWFIDDVTVTACTL